VIGGLYVANVLTLVINLAAIPLFVRMLTLPFTILAPVIFVLCIVGGYAPNQSMHDVWLMLIFGVVGYFMKKFDYSFVTFVVGFAGMIATQL